MILWTAPSDNGSEITRYTILIRHSDGVSFSEEPVSCDGSDSLILFSLSCFVPITTLNAEPYNLVYPDDVYAKLYATNIKGDSQESEEGNGASLISNPDAPINVEEAVG
jgi:hypothetical protein